MRDPAIPLLDEATSALDASTEARVEEQLASFERAQIAIAHRLSTVAEADLTLVLLVLVMENGRLVEQGEHAELVRGAARTRGSSPRSSPGAPHGSNRREAAESRSPALGLIIAVAAEARRR